MFVQIWNFVLSLPRLMGSVMEALQWKIPLTNFTLLGIISVAGLTFVISWKVVQLMKVI